jgi:hypothetical protein
MSMFVVLVDYLAPKSYSDFHLIGGFEGLGRFEGCYFSSWWELELCKNRDECKALSSHYLVQAQKYNEDAYGFCHQLVVEVISHLWVLATCLTYLS